MPVSRLHSRTWIAVSTVAAAALLISGCSVLSPGGSGKDTATDADVSEAASPVGCVVDPAAVVARKEAVPTEALPEALVLKLRSATEEVRAQISAPGTIVAVQTPEGRWVEAFGVADPATGRAMSVDDAQRIGSITKTFTGSVILQLAEEGKLSLDDPISRYVDGVPNGENISLRVLITMTSGLASYTLDDSFQEEWFGNPQGGWTPEQLLAKAFELPPLFAPGEQFNYSNTNFILLGQVIEKVTERSYAEALAERIFDPMGLSDTFMPVANELPEPHSTGFTMQATEPGATEPLDATDWNPSFGGAAGQLVSTIGDMLTYGRALGTGGGLLDDESQIQRLTFPEAGGYGEAMGCVGGWVGHTGELPGYNTSVFYDTGSDTTVITMTNSDIPSGECTSSLTLPDNPSTEACMAPATRVFVGISKALGNEFSPPPMQ